MRRVSSEKLMMIREECIEPHRHFASIEGLTFPDDEDIPTECFQLLLFRPVSFAILFELIRPKFAPGLWVRCSRAAAMSVPETSMDENDFAQSQKDQIGCSRKVPLVKAKPIP